MTIISPPPLNLISLSATPSSGRTCAITITYTLCTPGTFVRRLSPRVIGFKSTLSGVLLSALRTYTPHYYHRIRTHTHAHTHIRSSKSRKLSRCFRLCYTYSYIHITNSILLDDLSSYDIYIYMRFRD